MPLSHHGKLSARPGACLHHALSARLEERTRVSPAGPSLFPWMPVGRLAGLGPNFFSGPSRSPLPRARCHSSRHWEWHLFCGHLHWQQKSGRSGWF